MNSLTNESTYEVLSVTMNDLIDRIMSMVNEHLDDAQPSKNIFSQNSMQPALYQVLCEIKDKMGKMRITGEKQKEYFDLFFSH